jgi:hypothetical protein
LIELLKSKIRELHGAELEKWVRRLLPTVSSDYEYLSDTLNHRGRVTKGPVDLLACKKANGRYIAVICTGQESGLKAKVLADIEKLRREDCEIRDKIDEVTICIPATVGADEEAFRKACAHHGWASNLYTLDRLADLASKSVEITHTLCAVEISALTNMLVAQQKSLAVAQLGETRKRFYNCGHRVHTLRTRLSMSPSQFVDLVDYDSEQRLGYLESETIEMSQLEIAKVCNATGACTEWLTHGDGNLFSIEALSTYHRDTINWLRDAAPASVHMLINDETQQLVVLAHLHSKNWKIYRVAFDINFARWWGDHYQIPEVYDMLKQFADNHWGRIYGRVIKPQEQTEILSGQTHPGLFLKNTNAVGIKWFEDIFDYQRVTHTTNYYETWYGSWFTTAQDYFSLYVPKVTITNP